jgi:exodeoxyribonuclease VII small subunit
MPSKRNQSEPTDAPLADGPEPSAGGTDEADLTGVDFESALAELETLVDRMEGGEMSLEESLAAFERGVRLTRHCQAALRSAELKVKRLTADNRFEDLDPDAFDED